MTVSAVDVLQSSNASEDRNQRKTQRNDSVEGLFSMLMQKANLQQVASVGLSSKLSFDFSPARSNPRDLPADPPPVEPRAKDDDTATAAPAQPDEQRGNPNEDIDAILTQLLGARNANAQNTAPAQTATGNATAAAADANANAANAALAAAAKPVAEQAAANAQSSNNATLKAAVTETPADLTSQPSNTLSASAAVAAQVTKAEGKVDPLAAGGAVEPDESMINNVLSRAPGSVAAQAARQSHADGATPPDTADAGPDTGPKVNAPVAPQTLIAATAARSATEPQTMAGQSSTGQPLASAQGTGQGTTAQRTADLPAPPRARPNIPPRLVTDQVAVQVQRAIGQGMDRIQIQLRPAELGRIDVRMEIGADGHMKAAISADRQDTLDLLQRDARHLQQALQESGLSTNSGSLSFSLNGEPNDFREQLSRQGAETPAEADEVSQSDLANKPRGRSTDGTYDIEA